MRLDAARTIRRLAAEPGDYKAIAAAARDRHRPGTLTLVVLNTVDAAREVYKQLRGGPADCTLLHSRFRGVERARLMAAVTGRPAGRIVVATQVVEAGIDLNAAVLITEAAPWPSLVQRAGRCNRTGRVADAELWWVPPAEARAVRAGGHRRGDAPSSADSKAVPSPARTCWTATSTSPRRRSPYCAGATSSACSTPRRTSAALTSTSPPTSGTPTTWTSSSPGPPGNPRRTTGARRRCQGPAGEYRCRVPLGRVNAASPDGPSGGSTRWPAAGPGSAAPGAGTARRGAAGQRRRRRIRSRRPASTLRRAARCPTARN